MLPVSRRHQVARATGSPPASASPTWNAAKRQLVSNALNALNNFPKTAAGKAQALRAYRALSDDALRVLANFPDLTRPFAQLTLKALDPADAANQDRRGPDDPTGYAPRGGLRAYVDTLDGRVHWHIPVEIRRPDHLTSDDANRRSLAKGTDSGVAEVAVVGEVLEAVKSRTRNSTLHFCDGIAIGT